MVTLVYFFSSHWLLNDILACALAALLLKTVLLNSWKAGTVLLAVGFCYDVFWVFLSPYFFGGSSVMVSVATSINLPILFEFPSLHYLWGEPLPPPACSKLGLGDLIFPGLLLSFLFRFDKAMRAVRDSYSARPDTSLSYWSVGLGAYILSLLLCGVALYGMGIAQPVLFYIVPLEFLGVALLAWRKQ